jgi:hypothetical protein
MDVVRVWCAILVASCGLALTACASTVSGTPVRARSSGQVDGLTAMLLSIEDIGAITGLTDLEITNAYDELLGFLEFTPEECIGVPFNTIDKGYRDSRYQAISGMVMQPPEPTLRDWVDEAVVQFATAADAHRFVTESAAKWRNCAGTEVRAVPDEENGLQIWKIGDTSDIEVLPELRGLMVRTTRVDVAEPECAHAMTDRANIVIDVVVCGQNDVAEAETILERIANRPPV